jgi:integrase
MYPTSPDFNDRKTLSQSSQLEYLRTLIHLNQTGLESLKTVRSKSRIRVIRAALKWCLSQMNIAAEGKKPADPMFADFIANLGGTDAVTNLARTLEPNMPKRRTGRVNKLRGLPTDWAMSVVNAIPNLPKNEKAAVMLMAHLGFRPSELPQICLKATADHFGVVIVGKKIKGDSGQSLRGASFEKSIYWEDVMNLCTSQASYPFETINAKRIERVIQKASMAVFGDPARVTASTFRNLVASEAKSRGWPPEKIACLLGHQSQRTQKYYGRASLSSKYSGWIAPTDVRAQVTPRPRNDSPPEFTRSRRLDRPIASN